MIFIIILVIVFVVIYNRKKTKEQEQARAENIMQGSEFQPLDESPSINTTNNPFIDNTNTNAPVNNDTDYQSNHSYELENNPFVSNEINDYDEGEVYEGKKPTGYDFPLYPSKRLGNTNRKIVGKFSYNNQDYVALSYCINSNPLNFIDYHSYFKDGIYLDFGKVKRSDGKTSYVNIPYGYLWLKLLKIYGKKADLNQYINLEDMPNIPESELDVFLQVELSVRELSQDAESLVLSYDGENNEFYWQYGTVDLGGNSYALLVAQNNIEDTSIHKVTENENGGFTYTLVTDVSLQRMIMNAYDKKNK